VVVVDDGGDLADPALAGPLERLVRAGRNGRLRVVAAAEVASVRGIGGPLWIRELRKDGRGILLRPELPEDASVLATELPRRLRVALPAGRGLVVAGNEAVLTQIAE
jgi:hypothetical protein